MTKRSQDVRNDILRIAQSRNLSPFEQCEQIWNIFRTGFFGKELIDTFPDEYRLIYDIFRKRGLRQIQHITLTCVNEYVYNGNLHLLNDLVLENMIGQTCPKGISDEIIENIQSLYIDKKEEFLQKAVEKYGDLFDYSKVIYLKSDIQVCVLCKRCGEKIFQTPHSHINAEYPCISCAVHIEGWQPPDNEKASEHYAHVFNGLFISDIFGPQNVSWVQARDFGGIIDLSNTPTPMKFAKRHEVMRIAVDDNAHTNLTPYFERTYRFIDSYLKKGKNVLVFCRAGRSRSASIVLYYLMKTFALSTDEALAYLKKKRPQVGPISAFIKQLEQVEIVE